MVGDFIQDLLFLDLLIDVLALVMPALTEPVHRLVLVVMRGSIHTLILVHLLKFFEGLVVLLRVILSHCQEISIINIKYKLISEVIC